MLEIKITKKQFEKMAEQFRILSWAQGAIMTSASGFGLRMGVITVGIVVGLWVVFQIVSLILDEKRGAK